MSSTGDVPSIKSKPVCASVVQVCFSLRFLCSAAGTLVNSGSLLAGKKAGKIGKGMANVFSFNETKRANSLVPLLELVMFSSFSKTKHLVLKNKYGRLFEVIFLLFFA